MGRVAHAHVLLEAGALRALPAARRAKQDGACDLLFLGALDAVRELVQERLGGEAGEVVLGHFLAGRQIGDGRPARARRSHPTVALALLYRRRVLYIL